MKSAKKLSREERIEIAKRVRAEGGSYEEAGAAAGRTGSWAQMVAHDGVRKVREKTETFLVASSVEMQGDRSSHQVAREISLKEALPSQVQRRWSSLEQAIAKWRTDRLLPSQGTKEYTKLEGVKVLFKKEPGAWLFKLMEEREPWLLSHLVRWSKVRYVRREGRGARDLGMKLGELHKAIKQTGKTPARVGRGGRTSEGYRFLERLRRTALDEQDCVDVDVLDDLVDYCKFTVELASPYRLIRMDALRQLKSGEMDRIVKRVTLHYERRS